MTFYEYEDGNDDEVPRAHAGSSNKDVPFYRTHPKVLDEQRERAKSGEKPTEMFQNTYRPEKGVVFTARDLKQSQNIKAQEQNQKRAREKAPNLADEWVWLSYTLIMLIRAALE